MISHRLTRQVGAIEEVKRALAVGELTEEVIDAAFERVMQLKRKYFTFEALESTSTQGSTKSHQQTAGTINYHASWFYGKEVLKMAGNTE